MKRGGVQERFEARSRAEWRRWLRRYHARADEIWLVMVKKAVGGPRLCYDEAVEEAICYGWIDGTVRRLDDTRYMQRYTPRRPRSSWSELNLLRARRMIAARRMTDAGLAALGDALERYERDGTAHVAPRAETAPPGLMALLEANPEAMRVFEALSPSRRRQYLGWVMDARQEPTRVRRMTQLVQTLAAGRQLGMK